MGEIVLKNITFGLTPEAIDRAISEVRLFNGMLKMAMQSLIDYLAEKGVEVARAELIFFDDPAYMSGALSESVQYRSSKGEAVITAGEGLQTKYGSYAMFVEYGTGIVGDENPNPQAAEVGYQYDVHGHGHHGWWYPAPWGTMQADDGTMLAWTKGMPPRPFMQHTLYDLEDEAEMEGARVIAEYFGR